MDPNFSVLLGEANKNKTCDQVYKKSTHSITGSVIAAFFAIVGVAILGVLFVRFLYPKLKLAYQVRKHKPTTSKRNNNNRKRSRSGRRVVGKTRHDEDNEEEIIEIERMQDMELYTEAGKFVVNM